MEKAVWVFSFAMADSVTLLSAGSEVHGMDQANTRALFGYVGSAEVEEMKFGNGFCLRFCGVFGYSGRFAACRHC